MGCENIQKSTLVEPILFGFMLTTLVLNPTMQQLVYDKVCLEHWNQTYCQVLEKSTNVTYRYVRDLDNCHTLLIHMNLHALIYNRSYSACTKSGIQVTIFRQFMDTSQSRVNTFSLLIKS